MTKDAARRTNRRRIIDPDAQPRCVFVLSDRHERADVPWHRHRRAQLIHVSAGVLTVTTRTARFVIPPQRAVWVDGGVEHRIAARAPFWLTTCYVEPGMATMPAAAHIVAIDRLLNELLIAAAGFGGDYPEGGAEARLIAVLLDRMQASEALTIALPEPRDERLRRITDQLLEEPELGTPLVMLAADAALTERTAARLFLRDTGMTFGRWRQLMRLQRSLEHLAGGQSVTQAAFAVGYADVSSFIAAFKAVFGTSPGGILNDSPRGS